jgi:hypothetical protein
MILFKNEQFSMSDILDKQFKNDFLYLFATPDDLVKSVENSGSFSITDVDSNSYSSSGLAE